MNILNENRILEKTIGNRTIYHEQVECAKEILGIFDRNEGPPILVAQMQQGKTDVAICVIDQFIKDCIKNNLKYEIIWINNISDNNLFSQSKERFLEAGLERKIRIVQQCNLDKFIHNFDIDRRLILIDECHIALGKDRPFNNFLIKYGIEYGQSIDTWKNKNNYVASISATPYAHIIREKIDKRAFKTVVLSVNENYYSLQQIYLDNRLLKSEKIIDKKNKLVTKFLKNRIDEFIEICKVDGNGHMVIRSIGCGPEIIEKYIIDNYKDITVGIFDSNTGTISDIDKILSKPLPLPNIVIIKGSLRAGKTLTTTKYIRIWIEPEKSKTDTMCQVVGRCLGFEMENGKNRRFNDKFPLYCDIREIEEAILFFNSFNCAPTGINNKSTVEIKHEIKLFKASELEIDFVILNPKRPRIKDNAKEKIMSFMTNSIGQQVNKNSFKVQFISQNEKNDIASAAINATFRTSSPVGACFYIDAPNNNYIESWEKIKKNHPEWIGNFVCVIPKNIKNNDYKNKILDKCLLS